MLLDVAPVPYGGGVQIQLYNRGEDARHRLPGASTRAARGSGRPCGIGAVRPGDLGEATGKLRAGKYSLWCRLPGHCAAGMRAEVERGSASAPTRTSYVETTARGGLKKRDGT